MQDFYFAILKLYAVYSCSVVSSFKDPDFETYWLKHLYFSSEINFLKLFDLYFDSSASTSVRLFWTDQTLNFCHPISVYISETTSKSKIKILHIKTN